MTIEMIEKQVDHFNECLTDWYETLKIHYKPKIDEISVYGSIALGSRSNIPYLACYMYMKKCERSEKHRLAMKQKWANNQDNTSISITIDGTEIYIIHKGKQVAQLSINDSNISIISSLIDIRTLK